MRVVLYEWCSSGGLCGGDAALAAEGRMMLESLAADAAKTAAIEPVVLVDPALALALPPRVRRVAVPAGGDVTALAAAAREADWTIVVAPESDGLLLERVRAAREAGGRVLAPADSAIAVAADKQATIEALAARGVAVPAGCGLAAGDPVPDGFHLPAVRKARGGCGCEDLAILRDRSRPPAAAPTRLEAFAAGTAVGVSLLCGPRAVRPLPVMRQQFTGGDTLRFLGGEPLADDPAAARATALACRAAAVIGADAGWLGIDLILGERPDGRDDRVLELNPRLTTSFVGHTRLFATSLVAAMIGAAAGEPTPLEPATGAAGRFRVAGC